jgi:polyvinyl alcohol dehydrogenase (cytochrome)
MMRRIKGGFALAATLSALTAGAARAGDWPMFGQNISNTASADGGVDAKNAASLSVKWTFTTGGDVSARAAVVGGVVYFPDWGGNIWAVDADKGTKVWGHQLSDYGLPANTHSRTSPAVEGDTLYIGTQEGGWLLAIKAKTGDLVWKTQIDSSPLAAITSSPTVDGGVVYVGGMTLEEFVATNPAYPCCFNRGSVAAVLAADGSVIWRTFTAPAGYSGADVWGSNPVVDDSTGTVYVGTGNNFSKPNDPAFTACMTAGGTEAACLSPDDHVDSMLALDMRTGAIKWSQRLTSGDDWNVACFVAPFTNCPQGSGPDYDFGSAPNLFTIKTAKGNRKVIGAGQKSGVYSVFDAATGNLIWATQVGPGSSLGGMEWGSATDGNRVYVAISNFYGIPYAYGNAGSFAALDAQTGSVIWQVADPNGAVDIAPVAVSKDVVFVGSMGGDPSAGTMLALDAATGQTLWSFASGASVNAGAVIADNTVYWGSGYAHLGIPGYTGNNKFYAFSTK